jgi:protease-4
MLLRRMLLVLVPFVFLSGLALARADETKDKKTKEPTDNLIAQIKLSGSLADAAGATDLPFGPPSSTLSGMIDRLKKARQDDAVKALYLQFEGLSLDWGKLNELRAAIADFKKSGKKVFAYLEQSGQMDYLLACACDEVIVPPAAFIELHGVRYEMMFFKNLLESFGLKFDAVPMGDFKAAMENFTRSEMSPANRQQWSELADDFYAILCDAIASSRPNLTPERVRAIIDRGPLTAREALDAGLVDRICYPDAILTKIQRSVGNDQLAYKPNYGRKKQEELDFGNPFALLKLLAPPKEAKVSAKPKVAVIYAEGAIVTGKGGPSLLGGNQVGSATMVEAIRKAEEEPTVKAIVLRVDSPGGSALASDLIWHELKKAKKPVIASMGDVAGSGGYYISMAARKIYAEPGTITGSIGVISGKLVLGGALKKYGINTDVVARGKMSGMSSFDTPFSPEERQAMVRMMSDIYDQFLTKAFEGRQAAGNAKIKSLDELKKLAGGRIYSGKAARENGLIDELGTLDDAIAAARQMAGLSPGEEVELLVLPKARSFLDSLMDPDAGANALLAQAELRSLARVPGMSKPLQMLELLLNQRSERIWLISPAGFLERK